jgi:hypothetical protein
MAENFLLRDSGLVGAQGFWVGAKSGDMTGLLADDVVYQLRNIGTEPAVISKVILAFVTKTAFTAAQQLAFTLHRAVSSTTIRTGGLNIFASDPRKRRSEFPAFSAADMQGSISNAAALGFTAGAGTINSNSGVFDMLTCGVDVAASAGFISGRSEWWPTDRIPLTLGPDESLIVNNVLGWGAGGVGNLFVGVEVHKS